MPEFNAEKFLNTPIDAFDFQFMIADVRDFLEASESNLEWQHRRELRAIAHREDLSEPPPGYLEHLTESVDHRFKVSLALRVRYGALLAFTTSVEWAIAHLNKTSKDPVVDRRDGTNFTVRAMREFAVRASVDAADVVDNYEALVRIRNCITHSSGLVGSDKFGRELVTAAGRIPGILVANWHFFGDQICIERGALESHIERTAALVVELHTRMREEGLLK